MKDFSPLALTSAAVGFIARVGVITRTDGTTIRFAESDEPVVIPADATYSVVPGLQISAVKHTNNGEMPSCEITAVHDGGGVFDTDDVNAGLFDGAAVQIYYVDRSNLSRKGLLFTGAISDTSYDPVEHQVVFSVKGPGAGARIVMIRRRAPMCQTDFGSVLCGIDLDDYKATSSIDAVVDSFNFTVTGSLAQADGYFNGGALVTETGKSIDIAGWTQSTQTIKTYLPCDQFLAAGMNITLYKGCNKTLGVGGCADVSNQLNFQGEPHWTGAAQAAQQV